MRSGWFHEQYRHSLAAKGIKTRYFASRSERKLMPQIFEPRKESFSRRESPPVRDVGIVEKRQKELKEEAFRTAELEKFTGVSAKERAAKTALEAERAKEQLKEFEREKLEKATPVAKTIKSIREGRYDQIDVGAIKKFTPEQLDAVTSAARSKAIQMAQVGLEPPESVSSLLDSATKRRVKDIQETVRRTEAPETAGQIERRELAKKFLVGVAETPGLAARKAVEISREQPVRTGDTQKQFTGITGTIDELSETPFFKTNALLDEPGLPGYNKEQGSLNYPAGSSKEIPGFKGAFGFIKEPETTEKKIAEKVQLRVDSIHRAKSRLADADTSAYKKGTKAFEKGDRERLISSINELEAQGSRLKDNWGLVDQVHVQVISPENNMSAHEESWSMLGSNGGDKLADQTKKMNDVREEIKDKYGQVKSRSRLLQYRLQRLDSNVKPEHGAPREIARLAEERSGDNLVFGQWDARIPVSQAMPRKEDIRRYTPAWLRKGG